jgi:hypothetical protein
MIGDRYTLTIDIPGDATLDAVEEIITTVRGLAKIEEISRHGKNTPRRLLVTFELDAEMFDLWELRTCVEQLRDELGEIAPHMRPLGKPERIYDHTEVYLGDMVAIKGRENFQAPFIVTKIEEHENPNRKDEDTFYGVDGSPHRRVRRGSCFLVRKSYS